jgi:hypothetical protein
MRPGVATASSIVEFSARSLRFSPIASVERFPSANLIDSGGMSGTAVNYESANIINQMRDVTSQPAGKGVIKKLCESRIFHRFGLDGLPTHIMQLTAD